MFLNTIKFNKHIKWKKYKNLFSKKNTNTLYFQVYNSIDIKPLNNFFYIKENFKSKIFFQKNIVFKEKSKKHLWWYYKIYENFNL